MPESLCVLCCRHFEGEAAALAAASSLPGVRCRTFPARCGRPPVAWEELEALRTAPGEPLLVLGGACLARLTEEEAETRGITLRRFSPCASMVLNPRVVDTLLHQGAYLLTPGWLKGWRSHLAAQGGDQTLVREVWREGAIGRLVLMDTGLGVPPGELQALSDQLGIPWEVLPTGLDHLQLLVERDVLAIRLKARCSQLEGDLAQARRQAADRATALDFLGTLSQSLREEDVVEGFRNLFRVLFQARDVDLLPPGDLGFGAFRETEGGFTLALGTTLGPVGQLRVGGLGFPQFKAHYLNLALSMGSVCALAVQNARACRAAEESRAYQRMMLEILDVFYAPHGTREDNAKALGILQAFTGVDALALELDGGRAPGWTHALGYPACLMNLDCRRCPGALGGDLAFAPPGGAERNARGSLWVDDLGTGCPCGLEGFRSAAFVRLTLKNGFQGWLQLHHRAPAYFNSVLIERIEGAARTVSIGLERRWAEADLRRANQELESRVRQRTAELDLSNQELRREVVDRTRAEENLEAQSVVLQAHLKELHCLYALAGLFEGREGTLEDLCQRALGVGLEGWSHPERTWASLELGALSLRSIPFRESPWSLREPILVGGVRRGELTVFADSPDGLDPFLPEEHGLIRTQAGMFQGLLERLDSEEAREKVEQQLRQSQKLEAIGTLAGGIAHDFNNALTPIVSLADLELGSLSAEGPLRQHLEMIREAAARAKGLVDQIMLFSRRKPLRLEPIELKPLVEEILRLVRATLPATIEIRQSLEACGLVQGDPSQIHQVVLNLCTNAFHAMQDGGGMLKVKLEGVRMEAGDLLCAQGLAPGRYARLEVSDTGAGMSREVQARVFEPFFTTKEAGKGTGLGLAVVHGIIASCRGHIAVYSEPGLGTTFRIFLPLAAEPLAAREEPSASLHLPRGRERVLVVDDEAPIRAALGEILGGLGYRIEAAAGGAEALTLFRDDPEGFDLVVTDMTMPRMTGVELARRMRALRAGVRVVVCSGFSEHVEPEDLRAVGIHEFVQKPFAVAALAQAVRRELDRLG